MIRPLTILLLIVGCATVQLKEQEAEDIILGSWEGNLILNNNKLTFTFLNNGTLKSNFNDEDVLTWELKGDTLTFYENGKIDDIVYLQIINENKIIIKDETTDTEGMPFIRTIPNPLWHFLNKLCGVSRYPRQHTLLRNVRLRYIPP